jgi:hypothetical protein
VSGFWGRVMIWGGKGVGRRRGGWWGDDREEVFCVAGV